jgi:MOSC domain-containing protein YiiM
MLGMPRVWPVPPGQSPSYARGADASRRGAVETTARASQRLHPRYGIVTPTLAGIFVGSVSPLPPEGQPTGIFKHAVTSARVGIDGLVGDRQADRRFHGGPEKAVHHYAAENYADLAAAYPSLAPALVPGSLGENLSTRGWTEDNVHIGDVFGIGAVRLQVSQPRSPCWKINHRFGVDDLSRTIATRGLTGWYYRVLAPGTITGGDPVERIGQEPDPISVRRFREIVLAHRPDPAALARLAASEGLNAEWRAKLAQRLEWLRRDGSRAT